MNDIKELAKWLEEEVEFLKNNEDYVGGWYDLGNGLAAVVLWEEGWGDEVRDDCIQSAKNPDWALCAGIMLINRDDTPDGWFMPWDSETGDIICETTGIMPTEDYEFLAKYLLDDFDRVKDCEIKPNGETICKKESEDDDDSWDEKANKNDGEKPWDDSKHFDDEEEIEVEEESLKEELTYEEIKKLKDETPIWVVNPNTDENEIQAFDRRCAKPRGYIYSLFIHPYDILDYDEIRIATAQDVKNEIDKIQRKIADIKSNLTDDEDDDYDSYRKLSHLKFDLSQLKDCLAFFNDNATESLEESCSDKEDESLEESKKLHEDKEFHSSPYHDVIAEYFDYDGDFEFLDVVASIIGRVDDFTSDEDIWTAIDDELIYTYDQWTVLEHYCTPQDANWEVAFENLSGDIFGVCATIAEANSMSEEEPEEENDDNE